MSSWRYMIAGAAGAVALRKAADHLHHHHPQLASRLSLPAHYLRQSSETLGGLDVTRPATVLATLAALIEGRPPAQGDEPAPPPRGLFAALSSDGWTMSTAVRDGHDWDVIWQKGWRVVHDARGLGAYAVTRYFGRYWLLAVKDEPITGWIIEADDDPLYAARSRPNGFVEGKWIAIVVRDLEARDATGPLSPADLTRAEMHDLAWHESKGRRCFSVHTYTHDGQGYAAWCAEDEAHKLYTYIGEESAYKARWTRMLRERRPYNVMIYGPPGCGKTTLMRAWFEEEGVRVAEINAADLVLARDRIHQVFAHKPDVLLIEDFDRIKPEDSGQLLWLFEHSAQDQMDQDPFAHQPMIFATSNHPARVADAFWRPGRFDQVVEVDRPREDQWPRLVHEIAARFGLDSLTLTDAQRERCNAILSELSVAHLEQYMQRLALDPSYEDMASDRTFDPPVRWEG